MPTFASAFRMSALGLLLSTSSTSASAAIEQRNEVAFLDGPYNGEMFRRHFDTERYGAAFHYHHGRQHDVLLHAKLPEHTRIDREFNRDVTQYTYDKRARTGPTMELFGPDFSRVAWKVYRAIDWAHVHHEQTYDIMADKDIPWDQKKAWTERALRFYLEKNADVARSVAPIDVTMRRVGAMMKPYFTYYRNYYPQSNNYAYVAHWWHPAIYESMMIAGNDGEQERVIAATNRTLTDEVFRQRPLRMVLSREIMPRYTRMTPESANVFDNLHMLHGLTYDILAYNGWTPEQKRQELYRVVAAMSYRPGDEKLARKIELPHPDMDPRVYYEWMRGYEGGMNRIMEEMLAEAMPQMMPQGMSADMRTKVMAQFRMKLSPGLEPGEIPGSLGDALMKLMPDMKTMPEAAAPGATPANMVAAMLKGWQEKYGSLPDIDAMPMRAEPTAPAQPMQTAAQR